jgi:FMN-dependent NADH-azoreductase
LKKLLHIIATPRGKESRTLMVSGAFLDSFHKSHPGWVVDELNLFKEEIPALTTRRVDGKYILLGGKDLFGKAKEAWAEVISHIERFKSADAYLVSTPMWNFSIPYTLKHYIDVIVQPRYLFRYTPDGVEGLVKDRRMAVIASRGGEYTTDQMRRLDFQEPYLRTIFGFVGITDIRFVVAEPMDLGQEELHRERIEDAKRRAAALADGF